MLTLACALGGGATGRAVRACPAVLANAGRALVIVVGLWLINLAIHGADAAPSPARVHSVRYMLEPPAVASLHVGVRTALHAGCVERNNVAFLGIFLDSKSTYELA
eukprot:4676511-Prymnesium_polylepis.1